MKKTILKLAALLAVPLLLLVVAQAQSQTVTSSAKIPFNFTEVVPCAGEVVQLTGTLHVVFHFTINSDGSFHIHEQFNPQGVSGVGLSSGRKYQGTGATQTNTNTDAPFPFEMTHVNNFHVVGQGPGNNFMIHTNTHITVNANGDTTAEVVNNSLECK